MNGDVEYQLEGGTVSFDTLWRLDQLAATLTDHDGWRVQVQIDPGVVLTATPARGLHTAGTPLEALLSPQQPETGEPASHTRHDAVQAHTALEGN